MSSADSTSPVTSGGGHSCVVYGDEREWAETVTRFVREGLECGQRVVYVTDVHPPQAVDQVLRERGVDVEAAARRGRLLIQEATDSYLRQLPFDPDVVLAGMRAACEEALGQGFPGVRIASEMAWCAREIPGAERVLEYELRLDREVCAALPLTGLCLFDRVSAAGAELAVAAHSPRPPGVPASHSHPVAELPLAVSVSPDGPGVRLHGHADLDTRSALAVVLRNVARMPGPVVHVDLAAMDFLDVDALAQLVSTTVSLRETGRRLVLQSPPASLVRAAAMFPAECDVLEIAA
ncbi:MEDS domain-containing protein [Streptomyces sp. H39-S7]|uniref:MEDS domain-containing protein n=1 Tax=Streptomyces sp. H39-S7 TaxID=3004357 RepID=UPI0022AF8EC7|nr:MEDS domain-containing protein [Streptomyces sp. H39-S7]MCZ4120949.1 MEDS domain-containing protein [Streptomyces sp. H39-S7]